MIAQSVSIAIRSSCPRILAGLLAAVSVAWLTPPVGAQPATEPPGSAMASELTFTVSEGPAPSEIISVPVNRAMLVDFSIPIREVRVANPAIADVSVTAPRQVLVSGKSYGTTQLFVVVDGNQQRMFTLAVDLDLARLQAAIDQAVPDAQVKASGMLDTVVLTGTVRDVDSAERIAQIAGIYSKDVINQVRVAGVQQVLLRVTVAEVNRTATRQLGFNGWIAGSNSPDLFAVQQLNGINPVNIGGAAGMNMTNRIPFVTDSQNGLPLSATPTLSLGFPRIEMQVFIQALRENNLLKVLAEPNLVTISGEQASFLAGGEFPVPVPQSLDSITIEFRKFGVQLNFTPTVLSPDVIRLQVAPEVSEPDYTSSVSVRGYVVPGLTSRRVDTSVELGPGQTFAIGGLLSETTRAVSSKVPALGDIPVLGALFSSVEYQSHESELVVLVTPELVAPLNPDQITHVPGADHIPPNDWELFCLGQIEGQGDPAASETSQLKEPATATEPAAAMRLRGPIGPAGAGEGA